jgi:hypothetical protein
MVASIPIYLNFATFSWNLYALFDSVGKTWTHT